MLKVPPVPVPPSPRCPALMLLLLCNLLCSPAPDHTQTLFKLYLSVNKIFPVLLPVPVESIKELQTFPGKEMQLSSGSSHIRAYRNDFIQDSAVSVDQMFISQWIKAHKFQLSGASIHAENYQCSPV